MSLLMDAPALKVFDPKGLLARVAGDRDCMREIVKMFLAECPGWVADAVAAVEARDAEATRLAGHLLAGTLSNFGADRAIAAARRLELMGKTKHLADADGALADLRAAIEELVPLLEEVCAA